MPVSYEILPSRGVVYVRYSDKISWAEGQELFARYAVDPAARPDRDRHLVDLAAVTEIDHDWARLMIYMAEKADHFVHQNAEILMAYYAPHEIALKVADVAARAWVEVPHVTDRVLGDEADALGFLGQRETNLADFLTRARAERDASAEVENRRD